MQIFEPINPLNTATVGCFDFPRNDASYPDHVINTPGARPNTRPGDDQYSSTERWYSLTGFGIPKCFQGWPNMYESGTPGPEDPPIDMPPDLRLDYTTTFFIDHTVRFSGTMVENIDDGNHEFKISVWAHALNLVANPILLNPGSAWTTIAALPPAPNVWYYLDEIELIHTLHLEVNPTRLCANKDMLPGFFHLIIDWEFRHKPDPDAIPHIEPFGGSDTNLTFRIGEAPYIPPALAAALRRQR